MWSPARSNLLPDALELVFFHRSEELPRAKPTITHFYLYANKANSAHIAF